MEGFANYVQYLLGACMITLTKNNTIFPPSRRHCQRGRDRPLRPHAGRGQADIEPGGSPGRRSIGEELPAPLRGKREDEGRIALPAVKGMEQHTYSREVLNNF